MISDMRIGTGHTIYIWWQDIRFYFDWVGKQHVFKDLHLIFENLNSCQ